MKNAGKGMAKGSKGIGLIKSIELARKAGIAFAKGFHAKNTGGLKEALKKTGFPCVMKIVSQKASHKTELGGVITGIRSAEEAENAFIKLKRIASQKRIPFGGVLVQEQARGIEIIIGAKRDPQFGPVILFGLGGIFVEVFKDFSLRLAPVSEKDAFEMIDETRGKALLLGARGAEKANLKAIAKMILAVSRLMLRDEKIMELDLNPVFANGKTAVAVDARAIK
ncbi:MAG: acetate--CoA ligase family protein [archaeon]